jgi:CheY-like chemotaxis protein
MPDIEIITENAKTVMLIDDNFIDNFVNKKILEHIGVAKILTFTKPTSALKYLQEPIVIPQIILLDIYLPFMDGFKFLDEFEKLEIFKLKYIKAIILTVSVDPSDKQSAIERGYVGFIEKPLTKEKLIQQLNNRGGDI